MTRDELIEKLGEGNVVTGTDGREYYRVGGVALALDTLEQLYCQRTPFTFNLTALPRVQMPEEVINLKLNWTKLNKKRW